MPNAKTLSQTFLAAFCAILFTPLALGGGGMNIGARVGAWAKSGTRKFTVADYYDQHRYTLLDAIEFSGPEEHGTISKNWYDHATGGYADFYGYTSLTLTDNCLEGYAAQGSYSGRYRQDVSSYSFDNGMTIEAVMGTKGRVTSGTWNYSMTSPIVASPSWFIGDINLRGSGDRAGAFSPVTSHNWVYNNGVPTESISGYYERMHAYSAVYTPTTIKFYVDGVLATTFSGEVGVASFTNKLYQYIKIGTSSADGRLGCFRVFDAPLTDALVLANYAVDKARFGLT